MSSLSAKVEPPPGKTELRPRWQLCADDYVTDAAVSHDGALAAIATGGGEVTVVETASGKPRWRQTAHPGGVLAIAFSPRQALLATGGQDGCARLFAATGAEIAKLPGSAGKRDWVEHVAWSPNGNRVATTAGRVARLWTKTGEAYLETEAHPSTVAGIAWRKDSRQIASCCYGGVHLWAVESGAKSRQLPWKGSLVSIAWSPDGKVIACASQDASVHFWRLPSGSDSEMRGYPFKPKALAWDGGSTLLATSGDATITIWKFAGKGPEGKPPLELKGHQAQCTALAFAPNGGRLASGAQDTSVLLWEPQRGNKPMRYAFLEDEISKLVWLPDGTGLLAADTGGRVALYDAE